MFPIAPLIGAGVSALGMFSDNKAKQDANNINWASLFETKRANRATENMAKSSRRDAYGNLLKYTPGVGWEIDTTPMTEAILGSQQNEELRNLREDAPRNRAAAERLDTRSKMGAEEFQKKFNEFRFRPKVSESEDISDTTNTLLSARRKGMDEASSLLARQLIRTGGSSELAGMYKSADDNYAKTLQDAMLEGKRLGSARNRERNANDLSNMGGELKLLQGIADDTATTPVGNPGGQMNQALTGRSDAALQQLVQAMQRSIGSNQNAAAQLAQGVGNSGMDTNGLASILGRLDFGGGDKTDEINQYTFPKAPKLIKNPTNGLW